MRMRTQSYCDTLVRFSSSPSRAAGYDMEDAMILNAAAVQRGLAHGSLYKTDAVDLAEERGKQLVRLWARGLILVARPMITATLLRNPSIMPALKLAASHAVMCRCGAYQSAAS